MSPAQSQVFTVGHSNHSVEHFKDLLSKYRIEVLVDVRSWPHSRFVKWADAAVLPGVVREAGARYLSMGSELGGRPDGAENYDQEGHVLYGKVAASESFRAALERLKKGAEEYRVAMMCAEENPVACHRRLLVAKVLLEQGYTIAHIRGNGDCESESKPIDFSEGALFDDEENLWRSSLSVSHARPPRTSSVA
jgi:uncharacterized protein (DUF488 family)